MIQVLKDLTLIPAFYQYRRQGLVWLEPQDCGGTTCKSLHRSDKLTDTMHAYTRLKKLSEVYLSSCMLLGLFAGALVIAQLARVASF